MSGTQTAMSLRREAEALLSAVRGRPEFVPLLALVMGGAVWTAQTGIIPGRGFLLIGPAMSGLLWGCLYVGLYLAYGAAARKEDESLRVVWHKVGFCLILALLSAHLCKVLVPLVLESASWEKLFYLRRLLPLTFVGLWLTVLLPQQTGMLTRVVLTHRDFAPLPHLAVLLFAAAVLVSWADLMFERGGRSAVEGFLKSQIIRKDAWATNILILFCAYTLVFAITRRVATTMLLLSPPYAVLVLGSLTKIKYMHSAVQPLDLIRIPEFVPLFSSFFGTTLLLVMIAAVGLWIGAFLISTKVRECHMSSVRRWAIGGFSLIVLLTLSVPLSAVAGPVVSPNLRRLGIRGWEFRERARESGVLLSFLSEVREAFVSRPSNYSRATVEAALRKHWTPANHVRPPQRRVNVIVYLVESLMDPDDLGLRYTSDPIPTIRALRKTYPSGYVIVPEEFGGSANTEFEVLTGMTTCFLPRWSLPYRQYLRRPIPSLPMLFRQLGYRTTAVQPDPKYFFNRERAYRLLGFANVVWLDDLSGVERAAGSTWPSDGAVVDAVIRASQGLQPAFIFAFPSSTHSPYNRGTYRNSDLGVIAPPGRDTLSEVKEYINTLRIADRAVGRLIEHFSQQPDSTIIAIVGDHLPPLSASSLQQYFARLSEMSEADQFRMRRRVPFVVWSNFELAGGEKEFSASGLPSYLLAQMRLPATRFFAATDAIQHSIPVLPAGLPGCGLASHDEASLSSTQRELLADYRLLQYDLLLGKQYLLEGSSPRPRYPSSGSAAQGGSSTGFEYFE